MKKVISTTNAPAAIGPYSQAIEANGFVFASGQIPVNPATGEVAEGIEGQAEQVMKNMKNLLEAAGTSMENVVKTTVFIQSMDDFATINGIYSKDVYKRQVFTYTGNGFLYNMVRILTGTLLEVGLGKRRPEEMKAVLEARNREAAGATAPPEGLFLMQDVYKRQQQKKAPGPDLMAFRTGAPGAGSGQE